ncbi:MAG TPA: MBL fold metallo-hydrolase [Sphingobacteriaceae bacterium]
MSLFITSLNSGSNGNCYYVGNENEAILVDAGISCRETEKRLKRLGLSMDRIKAIFVSHEHSDHIRGIAGLVKKYRLPVYITPNTLRNGGLNLAGDLVNTFAAFEGVEIGRLCVKAFPKLHDASEPHSFVVTYNGVTVGVFTDIGAPCDQLIHHFGQCHAAFLEANYDDDMLDRGRYPYFLKKRIRGGKGHLSNKQALEVFITYKPPFMSHLFLSHLSKDNNCPKLVHELFAAHAQDTEIIVASRFEETKVYAITSRL